MKEWYLLPIELLVGAILIVAFLAGSVFFADRLDWFNRKYTDKLAERLQKIDGFSETVGTWNMRFMAVFAVIFLSGLCWFVGYWAFSQIGWRPPIVTQKTGDCP